MAPEYVRGGRVTRAADVYSTAVVLWEALTGKRLFNGGMETQILNEVLFAPVAGPGRHANGVPPELDAIVLRALDRDPRKRFATAREMIRAIEAVLPIATASEVGDWVEAVAGPTLAERARTLARIESGWAEGQTGSYKRHLLHKLAGRQARPGARVRSARQVRPSPSQATLVVEVSPAAPPAPADPVPGRAPRAARSNQIVLMAALVVMVAVLALPTALSVLRRWLPKSGLVENTSEPSKPLAPVATFAPGVDPSSPPPALPPIAASAVVPIDALPPAPPPANGASSARPVGRRHAR
jgi:serine/threonine-protein kinase